MSEVYGRKKVLLLSFILYLAATLGCALSPNYVALVVFRLVAGMGGATPISVIGGVYADIFNDPAVRGTATAGYTVVSHVPRAGYHHL